MRWMRKTWLASASALGVGAVLVVAGCYHTPVETSDLARGPAPAGRADHPVLLSVRSCRGR